MTKQCAAALSLAAMLCFSAPQALAAADYSLTIDGSTFDVIEGEEQSVTLRDGTRIKLKLERKSTLVFDGRSFTFEHPGSMSVSKKDLGDGIWQYLMTSATGSAVLIQSYDDLAASSMVDTLMTSMTDEDVAAGAKMETSPHQRTTRAGLTLAGKRATLKSPDDDSVVEVLAIDRGGGGLVFITLHDSATSPEDERFIAQFWESLTVK
jgi:hypothetical protein